MFKAMRRTIKTMGANANMSVLKNNMSKAGAKMRNYQTASKARGLPFKKGRMSGTEYASNVDDIMRSGSNKAGKMYNAVRPIIKPVAYAGMFALGATAMTGVAVMNGAMSAASDSMATRYMKDSRYSSKILQNRVGRAHGNGALSIGNHAGLSLAMSKSRHG